jgi:lipoprotein-anchoring transpeptidase ErfK/SrfK
MEHRWLAGNSRGADGARTRITGQPPPEIPGTCLNSAPVLRTLAALVLAAGLACAATPAAAPTRVIPAGVSVGGVRVGGLSAEPARLRVEAAFARPVSIAYRGQVLTVTPREVGAAIGVDAAVSSALTATPHSGIALPITYSSRKLEKLVAFLSHRYSRPARAARVVGASAAGPEFAPARPGLAVNTKTMHAALVQLLQDGTRAPLQLLTRPVPAKRTVANFGPVIVITRGVNTLKLYDGRRLVRTFHVATGQAAYPTPGGVWQIVDMQRNPWWHPPTSAWARGLKPIPPGPGNPLGTRWMGLDAAGVGIHGTNAPASIGYSLSHGCIRMQVPEAEWLFQHVRVGTPVAIL